MWRSAHTHINLRQLWPSVPWWVACELISWLVPTLCQDNGIVSPLQLQWVKSVCVFRCNLPPALLAEWLGSFTCHCSITGVEWTLHKSQHAKLTLKKKILPPLLLGFEPTTFRSRVQRSSQQATQLPHACSHVYTHTHTHTHTQVLLRSLAPKFWHYFTLRKLVPLMLSEVFNFKHLQILV